jgi:hypothetical protein
MAVIRFSINRDASGKAVVVREVTRIDPGDEIIFLSQRPDTAVRASGDAPFEHPSSGTVYQVPTASEPEQRFLVKKAIASTISWECGEPDSAGAFHPWPGAGPEFPGSGPDLT